MNPVDHGALSGPTVIPRGPLAAVRIGNSVTMPAVVIPPDLVLMVFREPDDQVGRVA